MKKTLSSIFITTTILISLVANTKTEAYSKVTGNPTNLFDIVFSVDSALISNPGDLVTRTQFTSFGTEPTLVELIYMVENNDGKVVFSEHNEILVETEQVVTKKFSDLRLDNGKYNVYLNTKYGSNVKDVFRRSVLVRLTPVGIDMTLIRYGLVAGITTASGVAAYLIFDRKMKTKGNTNVSKDIPWTNFKEEKVI